MALALAVAQPVGGGDVEFIIDQPGDHVARKPGVDREVGLALVHIIAAARVLPPFARSEEHTSELQSLMRISYAVFCLKKKKKHSKHTQHNYIPHHHH